MDIKTALKFILRILVILLPPACFIIAGSACMNVAKASGPWILNIPGLLTILLGCGACGYLDYKLIKEGKL